MLMFCFFHWKLQKKRTLTLRYHVMKDGGQGFITVPHVVIFGPGRGKCTDRFTPGKNAPLFDGYGAREGHRALLETLEGGKILPPTEIHNTTARLSSHCTSHYTN
jgi:hypothetical protein